MLWPPRSFSHRDSHLQGAGRRYAGAMNASRSGPEFALAAAALFGLTAPAVKLLAGTVDPWLLAGLLYLGSGISLGLYRLQRLLGHDDKRRSADQDNLRRGNSALMISPWQPAYYPEGALRTLSARRKKLPSVTTVSPGSSPLTTA